MAGRSRKELKIIARDQARLKAAVQSSKISQLRLQGASHDTIARLTGLTKYAVRKHLEDALQRANDMRLNEDKLAERFPRPSGDSNDAELRKVAFNMRCEGYTYDEIGIHLSVSPMQAQRYVTQRLELLDQSEAFDTAKLRAMALIRLDRVSTTLWNRIDNGDTKAIDALLKIEDRRAKLTGIDSPVRINIEEKARQRALEEGFDPEEVAASVRDILANHKAGLNE